MKINLTAIEQFLTKASSFLESVAKTGKGSVELGKFVLNVSTKDAQKVVGMDIETGGLKDPNPTFILSPVKKDAPKPVRDARGRFAPKQPKKNIVARFYYRKDGDMFAAPRVVTMARAIYEGESDRFHAYDLGRKGHRTFRFSNVKGGFRGITFTHEVLP